MTAPIKILVVDDEENILWVFKKALEEKGLHVHTAGSGEEAIDKMSNNNYLLIFTDIFMEGISGLDLIKNIQEANPDSKIVVMTAQDTMNNTIEAMKRGAYDYISKPFDIDEIDALVDRIIKTSKISAPKVEEQKVAEDFSVDSIIGKSKKMQSIFKTIGKAAATDLSVLITGESGTGKEMVARALHYYSSRVDQPFICINCAAFARELLESELFGHEKGAFTGAVDTKLGKFELADKGTLFLDEIGDMELQLQAKILRALQSNEFYRVGGKNPIKVNVRVIAATNQDLNARMEEKSFREDLYHRLNVIHIPIPPLRERSEDVPLLAQHFLTKFSGELAHGKVYLSPEVEALFEKYSWRGNIRELENVIKRGLLLASKGPILPEHLPEDFGGGGAETGDASKVWEDELERLVREFLSRKNIENSTGLYDELLTLVEKQLFQILLEKFKGNQLATAKALGINRNTLKRKIDSMNIPAKKKEVKSDRD